VVTDWAHMYKEYRTPQLQAIHAVEHHREWAISHLHAGTGYQDPALHRTVVDHTAAMVHLQQEQVFTRGGWHAHTWDRDSWTDFIRKLQTVVGLKFSIEEISFNSLDMVAALVKV
jgi:hypothetical protein